MEQEQGGSGVVVKGRATIDTRPPFRSVREAVALFGERVLVGEIYAKQLKEIQVTKKATTIMEDKENVSSKIGIVSAELEETKQNLQKTREEGNYMANCLKSLKQELEETKRELRSLKSTKERPNLVALNPEIEELKYVEVNPNNNNVVVTRNSNNNDHHHQQEFLFQKKKVVTFASPPSLTREISESRNSSDGRGAITSKLGRTSSFRKEEKKKKAVVSVVGWLFPKKKRGNNNNEEGDHHHARSPNNTN